MTDLRELFETASAGAPPTTRIDPYEAVRASRARTRSLRHRWLAGGVTAALVLGMGAVLVPRLRSPMAGEQAPATTWSGRGFDATSVDCSNQGDLLMKAGHLPEDFGTIRAAYRCAVVDREVPGDGVWQYQVVRAVTGELQQLQQVLEEPDAAPTSGSCTAEFDIGPPIWVVGTKDAALVRVPLDECGHALGSAVEVVDGLPMKKVSAQRLQQVESQTAVDSGCSQDFKDLLRIEASTGYGRPGTTPPRLDEGRGWTVCRYRAVTQDQVGSLASADRLSTAQVAAINAALAGSRGDDTCRRDDHSRFATITDGNDWLDVALDGCAVQQGSTWWRAPAELRRMLTR